MKTIYVSVCCLIALVITQCAHAQLSKFPNDTFTFSIFPHEQEQPFGLFPEEHPQQSFHLDIPQYTPREFSPLSSFEPDQPKPYILGQPFTPRELPLQNFTPRNWWETPTSEPFDLPWITSSDSSAECAPWVRWLGGLQATSGALEATGCGYAMIVTAPTGIGGYFGVMCTAKGIDNTITGLKQFWTCEPTETHTYSFFMNLTESEAFARFIDFTSDFAGLGVIAATPKVGKVAVEATEETASSVVNQADDVVRYNKYWDDLIITEPPVIAAPYARIPRFFPDGTPKSVTLYDGAGHGPEWQAFGSTYHTS